MTATATTGFRKGKIAVQINRTLAGAEPRTVDALIKGDWAVHRNVTGEPFTDQNGQYHDGLGFQYEVTHVPTGLALKTMSTLAGAKRLASEVVNLRLPPLGDESNRDRSQEWSWHQRRRCRNAVNRLASKIEQES